MKADWIHIKNPVMFFEKKLNNTIVSNTYILKFPVQIA